jgi:hypothetical protein
MASECFAAQGEARTFLDLQVDVAESDEATFVGFIEIFYCDDGLHRVLALNGSVD